MLNIEGALRSYLDKALDAPAHVAVPKNPPDAFCVVERTGGGSERTAISENVTVVVDYYGATRAEAYELAAAGDAAVLSAPGRVAGIASAKANAACVHLPDTETGRERYESTYNLVTFDYSTR